MSGPYIERPLARALEELLGPEALSFARALREAAITSSSSAYALLRKRLGDDGPVSSINIFPQSDLLRGTVDLSDTAFWMMGVINVRSTIIPQIAVNGLRGGPLTDVIAHRWLDDAMIAQDIRMGQSSTIIDVTQADMPLSQMLGHS